MRLGISLLSNRRAAVGLAMKYLIPLILGLIILVIYIIFFGAPALIRILEEAFPPLPE